MQSKNNRLGLGRGVLLLAMTAGGGLSARASADMFEDALEALRFAGFTVDANHSNVSNASSAVIGRNLQGNVIDLGDVQFSLQGPVAGVVQRRGRGIPTLEVMFSSGQLSVNPNQVVSVGPAQPVTYNLFFDSGLNTTSVDGNALFDARFAINRFGSYDLRLQFSDRQTVTVDGAFSDFSPTDRAVDLGPIDIEGNIFADALAVVTDPFFVAADLTNPFKELSGAIFSDASQGPVVDLLASLLRAGGPTVDELGGALGAAFVRDVLGATPGLAAGGLAAGSDAGKVAGEAQVPEPGTAVLMVVGLAMLAWRRWGSDGRRGLGL